MLQLVDKNGACPKPNLFTTSMCIFASIYSPGQVCFLLFPGDKCSAPIIRGFGAVCPSGFGPRVAIAYALFLVVIRPHTTIHPSI